MTNQHQQDAHPAQSMESKMTNETGYARGKGNGERTVLRLDYTRLREVDRALNAVCDKVEIDGQHVGCRYQSGHSDKSVAASMPFECSVHSVAYVRLGTLGHLYFKPPAPVSTKGARLADLEARVASLEAHVRALCAAMPSEPNEPND
jgi:hypothetical protein